MNNKIAYLKFKDKILTKPAGILKDFYQKTVKTIG